MDDPTRAVLALVDARELVDLASALIRIPSFKTEETQVALFLEKFFRSRDYAVDLQDPFDMPTDAPIVQAVARSYRAVTGQEPKAIGTVLPHSYSADDTCHLWKAGIPCLLYGPATIRGNADEDDACVLVSEMEKVTRVLAVTALDVCGKSRRNLRLPGGSHDCLYQV